MTDHPRPTRQAGDDQAQPQQQQQGQTTPRQPGAPARVPGYPAAFGSSGGGAILFRDLASL